MKKVSLTLLAGLITTAFATDYIPAVHTKAKIDSIGAKSELWTNVKFVDIELYPQTTIKFNDKAVDNSSAKAIKAKVGALYDGENVAFKLIWPDATESIQKGYSSTNYGDGFAVQFPLNFTNPAQLPYIGMGSEGRPVAVFLKKAVEKFYEPDGKGEVYHQQANQNKNLFGKELEEYNKGIALLANTKYEKAFIAEGFRSTTEIKDGSTTFKMDMGYSNKNWSGTLSKSLKDNYLNLSGSTVPVAFAVWDGAKSGRDGAKFLSSWVAVKVTKDDDSLAKSITETPKGDVKKGHQLAVENCASCHNFADSKSAPEYMAPNLNNIGGYSTSAYLKESITNPSAVIVPGYNRNAHPAYEWYMLTDGKRVSAMPSYDWLAPEQLNDLVAYLKTLKAGVSK